MEVKKYDISLNDSFAIKGIALILLLIHHLFYVQHGYYADFDIAGYGVVQQIGIASKACVAVFVFLSGYGLAKKYQNRDISLWNFYVARFTKLMMNYWLIWLLFVPVGILFWGRTPDVVYGNHVFAKGLIDFFGMANSFGFYGYNPTWWFMSCIILLYVLFPFLNSLCRRQWLMVLLVSIIVTFLPLYVFNPIKFYLIAFVAGIVFLQKDLFAKLSKSLLMIRVKATLEVKYLVLTIMIFFARFFVPYPLLWDSVIAIVLSGCYIQLSSENIIHKVLVFVGKHSMNIFLFHTFIYYYYFHDMIYWSGNPFFIFLTLFVVCLVVSWLIEWLKTVVRFQYLCQNIILKIQ